MAALYLGNGLGCWKCDHYTNCFISTCQKVTNGPRYIRLHRKDPCYSFLPSSRKYYDIQTVPEVYGSTWSANPNNRRQVPAGRRDVTEINYE